MLRRSRVSAALEEGAYREPYAYDTPAKKPRKWKGPALVALCAIAASAHAYRIFWEAAADAARRGGECASAGDALIALGLPRSVGALAPSVLCLRAACLWHPAVVSKEGLQRSTEVSPLCRAPTVRLRAAQLSVDARRAWWWGSRRSRRVVEKAAAACLQRALETMDGADPCNATAAV